MSTTTTPVTVDVVISILNMPEMMNDKAPIKLRLPAAREAQIKADVVTTLTREVRKLAAIKDARPLSTVDRTDWVNMVAILDLLTNLDRWDGFYLSTTDFFIAIEMLNAMLEESLDAWEESGRTSNRYGARAYHAVVFSLIHTYHLNYDS